MRYNLKVKTAAAVTFVFSLFLMMEAKEKVIEERFKLEDADYNPYILPVRLAEVLSFGDSRLISNLYWLKVVNYMGTTHYSGPKVQNRAAYPMTELITDLDPKFDFAYELPGVILSSKDSYFTRILESNCIFRKAQKQFPTRYQFYFWEAYNLLFLLGEEERAVELLYKAAPYAATPEFTIGLANRIIAKEGRYETAISMLEESYNNAKEEDVKRSIANQIIWIKTQRFVGEVNELIKRFILEQGKAPASLEEMVKKGYLRSLPQEPFGGYFFINEFNELESSTMGRILPWQKDPPFKELYQKVKGRFKCREKGGELEIIWPPLEDRAEYKN
ncbi:MAG: hypothetical protein Kow0090_06560 [Myxococcota bacterium]